MGNFSGISWRELVTFNEMIMMSKHNRGSSLKQQSVGRHVDSLGHSLPIPSQAVVDLII